MLSKDSGVEKAPDNEAGGAEEEFSFASHTSSGGFRRGERTWDDTRPKKTLLLIVRRHPLTRR